MAVNALIELFGCSASGEFGFTFRRVEKSVACETSAFVVAIAAEGECGKLLSDLPENGQRKIPGGVEGEFKRGFADDVETVRVPLRVPMTTRPIVPVGESGFGECE